MRALALLLLAVGAPAAAQDGDCLPAPAGAAPAAAEHAGMRFTREARGRLEILRAEGMIDAGAADRLGTALTGHIDEVWLDSDGGDAGEALRIGRALRARGTFTRVPDGARCAGACAEAFLGGVGRFVDPHGLIGFSAVPLSDPAAPLSQAEREQAAARWAEQRADYYIRAGVSRGLLRLQLDTPAPGICWLSAAGQRRYGVANVVGAGWGRP